MSARCKSKYSPSEKETIVLECIGNNKSITKLAKKYKVSRKTLYSWLKRYKNSANRNKNKALVNAYVKGKDHPKSKVSSIKSKVIRIVSAHPEWGARSISNELKKQGCDIGFFAVHTFLQSMSIERRDLRESFATNYTGPGRYMPDVKLEIINKFRQGETVSSLSDSYAISRKTLYQWIRKIQNISDVSKYDLADAYVSGEKHPFAVYPKIEAHLLSIVKKHPDYSIHKLAELLPVSSWTVWSTLSRNGLSTYTERQRFANQGGVIGKTDYSPQVRSTLEQFMPTLAPAPPPVSSSRIKTNLKPSYKQLARHFLFSAISSLIVALTTRYWVSILISASSFSEGIGLVLATVALFSGGIFFLYSLKYYLTLAVVLSYSQDEKENADEKSPTKFISWLLGKNGSSHNFGKSGLEPNLEHVNLKNHPYISVQIPFFNEKYVAERAISAAINFDYKGDYEVLVCDDSTDETTQIIRSLQQKYLPDNKKLKIFINKEEGWELSTVEVRPGVLLKHLHRTSRSGFKGGALKVALNLVDPRCEFITIFDADFVPYPDSLDLFLKYFKLQNNGSEDYTHSDVAAVQGYQWHVLNKSENWITRGVRSEYAGSYVIERSGQEIYGGLKHISGSVYMIRRAPLTEVGWDTSITEDYELTLKLYEKGYRVVYTPYIQAPAECVSTLKRLIRQRMRWAEGHSHNVKLMWKKLLFGSWEEKESVGSSNSKCFVPSPLTAAEKIEFLFNMPYYLQAFLFLIGTFAWLLSETVFQARLPFWTVIWGWSLILTNMFSLPLVNAVGLFLEESEDRDYVGLVSFTLLSYIVVPFQAYASLKGFLEKEEGGWFRTPKTGRITDVIARGRFYRFISGILPGKENVSSLDTNYLSMVTANNIFNTFSIKRKTQRWVGKLALTSMVAVSLLIVSFAPYIPIGRNGVLAFDANSIVSPGEAKHTSDFSFENETNNFSITGLSRDFKVDEVPGFHLDVKTALVERVRINFNQVIGKELSKTIQAKVLDKNGNEALDVEITKDTESKFDVTINPQGRVVPGVYSLHVSDNFGNVIVQDFSWGVLVINTNKSVFHTNEEAKISMAVLDEKGVMVCDAKLELGIRNLELGIDETLSTQNDRIKVTPGCGKKDMVLTPDYEAGFTVSGKGVYEMILTAVTKNGRYLIADSFEVRDYVDFDIERMTATRIYPALEYPVFIQVVPTSSFSGIVSERVPADFVVSEFTHEDFSEYQMGQNASSQFLGTKMAGDYQYIEWLVSWDKGEKYTIGYKYDAPDISPEYYTLGPVSIGGFTEGREWQIAVDAISPVVGFFTNTTRAWTVAEDTDLDLSQPNPMDGDLMLASIAIRPSASTVNTPTGWTAAGSWTGTDSADPEADNTGSVGLYWFYKVADGSEGEATQKFTENGTTSVWMGDIMLLRSGTKAYSISAGGYSINGDTGTWGGTLDTDIGLTSGDIVLIAGAQNGNPSASSAQNITATGINVKSTVREHGEFASTTGNNIEVDLAETQIWEGTNTDTPVITFTQGTPVSGAVSAIRIRQGTGTRRTDTFVRSNGLAAAGTASVSVPYPDHDIGDLLVMMISTRDDAEVTPTTPATWTSLGTYNGGAGSYAADSGNARITAFYKRAEARWAGSQVVAISGGDMALGRMVSIHMDDAGSWNFDVDGGADSSAGTAWQVDGEAGIDVDSANGGDVVLVASTTNTDARTYSGYGLTITGATITGFGENAEIISSTGNDQTMTFGHGEVTDGSATGVTPVYTMTANGTSGNNPAGVSMIIKVIGVAQSLATTPVMGFFSPTATWTAAADTYLDLRQPDPREGDLMLANIVIRPSTSTVDTPTGWTSLGSWTGTDGADPEAEDTGSVRNYWFYKVADGSEGTATQRFEEQGTTSVVMGTITQVRSSTKAYSLSAGGYSIDGDATNWNGTLDTDIGLTQGDLVLVSASQNGNLSNTSAWDINATGVNYKMEVREHGEYASTTGNDVEVGLGVTLIWEGTNSATPTVNLTQSAAASGAVAAVRIRQGTGTNRTDTWVRSAGAQIAGTTTVAVPYPENEIGDMLIMFVGSRNTDNTTPETPTGWTSLGTYTGGSGTFGADAGNARTTAFYKEVEERASGTQTVVIPSGTTSVGQMVSLHKDDVDSWTIDADGGSDNSGGTGWSAPGTGIDLNDDDLVIVGSTMNTDAYTYSGHAMAATNVTWGDVTQSTAFNSGTGNDMSLEIVTARVDSIVGGSVTSAPTLSSTASGSTANAPTGSSFYVKISGNAALDFSGIIYTGEGSSPLDCSSGGNRNVALRVDGSGTYSADCSLDTGEWEITGVTAAAGTIVTVFLDGETEKAVVITESSGVGLDNLDLYQNHVIVRHDNSGSLTIDDMNQFDGGTTDCSSGTGDSDVQFCAVSGTPDTLTVDDGQELYIWTGNSFAPGGTVTVDDIKIVGTYTAAASESITVSGTWTQSGTFTSSTSTVTFDAPGATTEDIVTTGSGAFNNVVFNDGEGGATWEIEDPLDVDGNFTITGGTVDVVSGEDNQINVGGNWTNDDTFVERSGKVVFDTSTTATLDSNCSDVGTCTNENFYDLELSKASSGNTVTLTNFGIRVTNTLTLTTGTLVQGAYNVRVEGATAVSVASNGIWSNTSTGDVILGGSFANSGIVTMQGTTSACGETDAISITSTSGGSQRSWTSLGGTFNMNDVSVQDQGGSAAITVYSGTNVSGNNSNWVFEDCVTSSTSSSATGHSFQRKTFYDDENETFWRFYHDGDEVDIEYSKDSGDTWSSTTALAYDTNDFSVWWKAITVGETTTEYVWMAVTTSDDILVRRGTLGSTSVTWDSEANVVSLNGTGASDTYSYPYISLDDANYMWVGARHYNGTNYTYKTVRSDASDTGNATWSGVGFGSTVPVSQVSADQTNANVFGNIVPLNGQDMYAAFVSNTLLQGCVWDHSDAAWEDSDGASCVGRSDWLSGWDQRLEITVDNTNIDSNLTHFPLLLTLGSSVGTESDDVSTVFDELASDANRKKIAVTKSDGVSEIYVEIEKWNDASEQAWLWVSSSTLTLSSSANTTLYLYYDSSHADNTTYVGDPNSTPAESVWDSNYVMVQHFSETSGTHYDSTSNNNDSTSITVTTQGTTGHIDGSDDFNPSADKVNLGSNSSIDDIMNGGGTVTAWINPNNAGEFDNGRIVDKGENNDAGWTFLLGNSSRRLEFRYGSASDWAQWYTSSATVPTGSFSYVGSTYDSSSDTNSPLLFIDGQSVSVTTGDGASWGSPTSDASEPVVVGARTDGVSYARQFDGLIDEVRLSDIIRSAAWLKADYYSSDDNLISWGSEETGSSGSKDSIDTVPSGLSKNISAVVDTTNYDVHLLFVDDESTDQVSYKRWDKINQEWDVTATLVAGGTSDTDAYVSLSYDTDASDLYAIWIDTSTNHIFYTACDISTQCSLASDWIVGVEEEIDWHTETQPTNLTSNYSSGTNVFAQWSDGSGSPYSVEWDIIVVPENIWFLMLLSPLFTKPKHRKKIKMWMIKLCKKLSKNLVTKIIGQKL
ncbi:glycosyltransferase [Candidatus Woesebacteria bacterium]|nr:MAG: glycosyltransferase [Candidatus Woesebacteria bacterium]